MEGLRCNNLSKIYDKRTKALDSVSFTFSQKGIISIIGRNGAGKTTLTRIFATNLMPDEGSAEINGINILTNPNQVRDLIAIVPQESRPIGWLTCKQSIITYLLYRGFSYKQASINALESLKQIGIEQHANTLSRRLSGGTKRKLTIATVLASDAKIIFLDEPTTGLDPISRNELWNMLEKLKKEYLIFLTTHYLEEAERLADKIGIMEEGKLLTFGTMDELRKKVKHEYSIRIMEKQNPITDLIMKKIKDGVCITGRDGGHQILTSKKEAFKLVAELIKKKVRFSSNPVSLEDIFYFIVKKPIEEDDINEKK